ncbi:MAG: 5-methyltetrahydropteroyltriglutamate--homocysteine S-methyltransferase, partial [Kocuria sp.]|nr:5-methyltetrahydropteroyltriglutamate--homocysteine S-methyltransferase [Kocuria sp.]
MPSTILGYPRIGPHREIKRALEAHWRGGDVAELISAISTHRTRTVEHLSQLGLAGESAVPFDGAVIDQVLDASVLLGLVPARFREAGFTAADPDSGAGLELLAALSRGTETLEPLELTKWFDTNYHYYVPELEDGVGFAPAAEALSARVRDLVEQTGTTVRPTLVGPVSFLLLAKTAAGSTTPRFDRLDELTEAYGALLAALADAGAGPGQLEAP